MFEMTTCGSTCVQHGRIWMRPHGVVDPVRVCRGLWDVVDPDWEVPFWIVNTCIQKPLRHESVSLTLNGSPQEIARGCQASMFQAHRNKGSQQFLFQAQNRQILYANF